MQNLCLEIQKVSSGPSLAKTQGTSANGSCTTDNKDNSSCTASVGYTCSC